MNRIKRPIQVTNCNVYPYNHIQNRYFVYAVIQMTVFITLATVMKRYFNCFVANRATTQSKRNIHFLFCFVRYVVLHLLRGHKVNVTLNHT